MGGYDIEHVCTTAPKLEAGSGRSFVQLHVWWSEDTPTFLQEMRWSRLDRFRASIHQVFVVSLYLKKDKQMTQSGLATLQDLAREGKLTKFTSQQVTRK